MIRIILHGCYGKMGRSVTALAKEMPEVEIVAGVDPYLGEKLSYPTFSSLEECSISGDVIIDFAAASGVEELLHYAKIKKVPVVLCTTGLSQEQLALVEETSKEVAVLRSANMSLGINLLLSLAAKAAKVLYPAGFDPEILEKHHNQKVDAPSGTALALADSIKEALGQDLTYVYDRSGYREKRKREELGISSIRGGSIVGEHDVIFAGTDEVITLSHGAYSKAVFAKGALEAARFLAGKAPGRYTMSHVIGLE